jgi:hypothetical protein
VKTLWSAAVYWPLWLGLFAGTFLLREIWALTSGHYQDTLSDWTWGILKIAKNEPISAWNGTDYLTFGCWLVLVTWLTWHLWFRRFT